MLPASHLFTFRIALGLIYSFPMKTILLILTYFMFYRSITHTKCRFIVEHNSVSSTALYFHHAAYTLMLSEGKQIHPTERGVRTFSFTYSCDFSNPYTVAVVKS